jgi:hypothetical protein
MAVRVFCVLFGERFHGFRPAVIIGHFDPKPIVIGLKWFYHGNPRMGPPCMPLEEKRLAPATSWHAFPVGLVGA